MAPHSSMQQYGRRYDNELNIGHQQSYVGDYDEGYYRRSSRRHKKKHGSGRRPRDYDYEGACDCDCRMCDPKPCCRLVCTCEPEAETNQDTGTGQTPENYGVGGPTNVVFVPYPFPLVVPGQQLFIPTATTTRATTETTTKSTTTKTTTTKSTSKPTEKNTLKRTKKPVIRENSEEDSSLGSPGLEDLLKLLKKDTKVRIGISKRDPVVRRLKTTTRFPKYGIVPLSDHLLESLISQVRNVKDLQSYS